MIEATVFPTAGFRRIKGGYSNHACARIPSLRERENLKRNLEAMAKFKRISVLGLLRQAGVSSNLWSQKISKTAASWQPDMSTQQKLAKAMDLLHFPDAIYGELWKSLEAYPM